MKPDSHSFSLISIKAIIYIICILLLFVLLYWLNSKQPVEHTWQPTYDTDDKQPYGAYALDKLLDASWKEEYIHTYKSIFDLKEEGELDGKNLLVIADYFNATESEIDTLLEYIRDGGTALIAAYSFWNLEKKFGFYTGYEPYSLDIAEQLKGKLKYNTLRFCTPELNKESYKMPAAICGEFFTCDSLDKIKSSVFIVAKSNDKEVIMLRYPVGKGSLLLSCNPLIYTNYGVLSDSANLFIWNSFAYLQGKPLIRTEYYHAGSNAKESKSIFRYLQSKPPLKWALNVAIATIILFMFFTAKRRQKAIPVVKPPQNKLLDFVRSVAGLYLRKNNNADIILKKQIYWADSLKRNYGIDIINETHDVVFFERLSAKTNKTATELSDLFRYLDKIDENTHVSDAQMMEIITKMNEIS